MKAKLQESWEELPTMFVTSAAKTQGAPELLQYTHAVNQEYRQTIKAIK